MVHAGQGALVYVAYKQDPRHRVLLIASSGNSLSDMLACLLSTRNAISLRVRKIKLRMSVWSKILRLKVTYQPHIGPQSELSTLRRVSDSG